MKEIAEITESLRSTGVRFAIIPELPPKASGTTMGRLHAALRAGTVRTDREARTLVYGSPVAAPKYAFLKSTYRKALLEKLFHLEFTRKSDATQALYDNQKQLYWAKILLRIGARQAAIGIARRAERVAAEFELTTNRIEFVSILREHAMLSGRSKAYKHYSVQLRQLADLLKAELVTSELTYELVQTLSLSISEKPSLALLAREIEDICEYNLKSMPSTALELNYYRTRILSAILRQQYAEAREVCDMAMASIESKPHVKSRARTGEFLLQKFETCIYSQDWELGRELAEQCRALFAQGLNNWFIFLETLFLFEIQSLNYQRAFDVLEMAVTNARFVSQPDHRREKWMVFERALKFAYRAHGKSMPNEFFRITGEIPLPSYRRDKAGYNVILLTLSILEQLETGDVDSIILRMDALRAYRSRYLRSHFNRQSALFFKMLQVMERSSFDPVLTERRSRIYFEQLKKLRMDKAELSEGLHILPYDWLWTKVLQQLNTRTVPRAASAQQE